MPGVRLWSLFKRKRATAVFRAGSKKVGVVVVVLMAITGSILLRQSFAANPPVRTEPEQGVITGSAVKCTDPAASQGGYVKFGAQACRYFTNPVKLNTADPGVLRWENKYYLVDTSGVPWFSIYVSDDLVNWQFSGKNVFNGPGTHPWGTDRFWAPEIHRLGDRFAVYYSASDTSGQLRVGVATATNILGPYTDLGRPLIRSSYGVIDVNFFRDDNGRQYLYWKEDGGNTRIFAQEINQAGTGFIGSPTVVLQKGLAWEGAKGIEGTWVMKKDGVYYMFYSGELYSSALYSIGVAKSGSPMAPFTKKGDPILRSSARWKGPGHNTVAMVGTNHYMVYHAWDTNPGVGNRVGLVDKINWVNGWPAVANGIPTEARQPYPF